MTTLISLATEYDCQPYELVDFLDLGRDYDETAPIPQEDEVWMRDVLDNSDTGYHKYYEPCGDGAEHELHQYTDHNGHLRTCPGFRL